VGVDTSVIGTLLLEGETRSERVDSRAKRTTLRPKSARPKVISAALEAARPDSR
jgi:hypothetical protein